MNLRGMLTCRLLLLGALAFAACADQVTPGAGEQSRQLGEDCDQAHDCMDGLFCEDGKCRKLCKANSDCKTGSSCQDGRCVIDVVDTAECGNGVQEVNETCDDGNQKNGDCCSASCKLEANCYCHDLKCGCLEGYINNNDGKGCVADAADDGSKVKIPAGGTIYTVSGTLNNGGITIKVLGGSLTSNSKENQVIIDNGTWKLNKEN